MKLAIIVTILTSLFLLSCSGTRKHLRNYPGREKANIAVFSESSDEMATAPIKEVEEKVIYVSGTGHNLNRYHVIIGSFRFIENAKKHQGLITDDGFVSELLRNDTGLYRVSVLSTADISEARDEIRRIRSSLPKYYDTWLLIMK